MCPESTEDNKCPTCLLELDSGYGYAGGYGLGVYWICPQCSVVYNFSEDSGL